MTTEEMAAKAAREKDKGNEAFRAGDYKEALLYYNRSMSIDNNVPACNNRAQCCKFHCSLLILFSLAPFCETEGGY